MTSEPLGSGTRTDALSARPSTHSDNLLTPGNSRSGWNVIRPRGRPFADRPIDEEVMLMIRHSIAPFVLCILAATVAALPAIAAQPPSTTANKPLSPLAIRGNPALPDGTLVKLGRRTVTLGQLRAHHRQRVGANSRAALLASSALGMLRNAPNHAPSSGGGAFGTSMSSSVLSSNAGAVQPAVTDFPVIEDPNGYAAMAKDMVVFCNDAKATVCLYYPSGMDPNWISGGGNIILDWDFIPDQATCGDLGGLWADADVAFPYTIATLGYACAFPYKLGYEAKFTVKPGWKFTYQAACDKRYWKIKLVDPAGIIYVEPAAVSYKTGDDAVSCLVKATLHPK